MNNIIEINNVSMCFNLAKERTDSLKETVVKKLKGKLEYDEFYALKDITLNIKKGESVALIGVNGSGKSTLLKIVAGVMYPTTGTVSVSGSIAPLIELGAGFDLDLTGKENIYLNGAVLGHDRKFMDAHYDEILEFSELSEFIDVPVKNYSSGMIARLGFAIATIVDSEVLIIDEVLAVGDYAFQQKCKERMSKLLKSGRTVLFVSHDPSTVTEICEKSVWLEHGKIREIGPSKELCEKYIEYLEHNAC